MTRSQSLDVIIFDMDGVLVDVSESYRRATCQTVQAYLEKGLGLEPFEGELVSLAEVAPFKSAGGFNNDWDLTTGLVKYFVSRLDAGGVRDEPRPGTLPEIMAFLRRAGARIPTTVEELARYKDLGSFAREVRGAGGGLAAIDRLLGKRNDWLVFAAGDLRETNLVVRMFEQLYLGDEYFRSDYELAPIVVGGPGLIRRERLFVSAAALEHLGARAALGIATGRPRKQADHALETGHIGRFFRSLVAYEEIVAEEARISAAEGHPVALGKPHPYTLYEAVRRIKTGPARCAYVGDTLDDVRAANAAKAEMDFVSIGCLAPAADKQAMRREFERAGADLVVEQPDDLVDLVR